MCHKRRELTGIVPFTGHKHIGGYNRSVRKQLVKTLLSRNLIHGNGSIMRDVWLFRLCLICLIGIKHWLINREYIYIYISKLNKIYQNQISLSNNRTWLHHNAAGRRIHALINWVILGPGSDFSPIPRQAITWPNGGPGAMLQCIQCVRNWY